MTNIVLSFQSRVEGLIGRLVGRLPAPMARRLSFASPISIDGLTLDPHVQAIRALRAPLQKPGLCQPTVSIGRARYVQELLALRNGPSRVAEMYRLAPEHPFPAAVHDAIAAVEWATANAEGLGAARDHVSVGGDSAGGGLATVAARALGIGPHRAKAQLLLYPVVEMRRDARSVSVFGNERLFLTARDLSDFASHYAAPPNDPRASPLRAADQSPQSPALVVTAGFDVLRDDGEAYADVLRQAGTSVQLRRFASLVHGFIHMTPAVPAAAQALREVATAWRALLDARPQSGTTASDRTR